MAFIPLYDSNPLRNIRYPWVAWTFIAINIIVYFVFEAGRVTREPTNYEIIGFGLVPAYFHATITHALSSASIPDLITIVTYSFLHANFWHLAGNMIFLFVFADNVEDAVGHVRYFLFYLLCAAAAGYGFVLSDPLSEAPVIGASGAVAGNIAAYLLLYPRAKVRILLFFFLPVRMRVEYVLGFWIAFQFYSAFANGDAEVAWWAHIGGLGAGAILVIFLRKRGVPLFAKELPEHPARMPNVVATEPAPAEPLPPGEPAPPREVRGPWE